MVVTAANPPPDTAHTPGNRGSSDDHQAGVLAPDQEDPRRHKGRSTSARIACESHDSHGTTVQGGQSQCDTVRVPLPRQGDAWRAATVERPQTAGESTNRRRRAGSPVGTATGPQARPGRAGVPTPEEWAREQLKNAPPRSAAWARAVAAIYGLDSPQER